MRYLRLYEELSVNSCPLDNEYDKQEIMELCEPFMIPLMDDDEFEYGISTQNTRYSFVMVYVMKKDKGYFTWGQVKDNVIPMFHMLCKKYMPDDWSVETGQQVHFWLDNAKGDSYYVNDLIFDDYKDPSDTKVTKILGLKLYQKRNYSGWGMRFSGETRR